MKLNLNRFSELQKRLLAASIGIPIMIGSIIWHPWAYFIIFFIICMLCMLEFYQLLKLYGGQPLKIFGTINGLIIYIISYLIASKKIDHNFYLLIFLGLSSVYLIKLHTKRDKKAFINIALTFMGIIYISVPLSLLHFSVFYDNTYHYEIIMGLLFILWASDTGAYFVGKNFGKKKLFERVSPKKTWEGSIGGGILAILVSILLSYYFPDIFIWKWLLVAVIVVVAGTYGDLVESLLKRNMEVKDSSNIIPGHGGFLDRFDGLLITTPLITGLIKLI